MKKTYQNNRLLAIELLRGRWLLRQSDELLPAAHTFLSRGTLGGPYGEAPALKMADIHCNIADVSEGESTGAAEVQKVLIIPLHGVLTKYDNCYGCSTQEVADILEKYRDDDSVCGFILDIDSPGGSVNAVMALTENIRRIRQDGKPIIAHVDQCCSAAYWIASQCDAIFADNILSELGSIGAYVELLDNRVNTLTGEKILTVYAPQSADKNKSVRDMLEGDNAAMEAELSVIVSVFQKQVLAGRPLLDKDAPGVLSGAVFLAPEAIRLGLANGSASLNDCIEIIFAQCE